MCALLNYTSEDTLKCIVALCIVLIQVLNDFSEQSHVLLLIVFLLNRRLLVPNIMTFPAT